MNTLDIIKERYNELHASNGTGALTGVEQKAFDTFSRLGVPTVKDEEWKYTRISPLFQKEYALSPEAAAPTFSAADLEGLRLPGSEGASELVFVNGAFAPSLSTFRSAALTVQPLEEAARNEFRETVAQNLGHSNKYIKDGIHALNAAFLQGGVFIAVKRGQIVEEPLYIYHVTDARSANILAQPRILLHVGAAAQLQVVETYATLGLSESFTNEVVEVAVEQDAVIDFYKIQNDAPHSNQVNTTHFRQIGKSVVNAVTISLNGGIIRNNLNMAMEAEHCEANMYGLYFLKGSTHVDNHTIVDNVKPHLLSNELYKGVIDDSATAVFNGKIYVQQDAQKINAFQSNKNILLSDSATVNTKPQLEIFADDVKCSHGCTVGQLDEEGMFYLRSRGIPEKTAKSLLVHAFAIDILEHIKLEPVRQYVDSLISERLEHNIA